jgi:hypothetical protein
MVRHCPNDALDTFDLIKHQREFSAYLQAARQLAGTLTKKGMSRVLRKWLASFRRLAKLSQTPDSVQDIEDTPPHIYI